MKILVGYSSYPYVFDISLWNEAWLARLRDAGFDVEGVCLTLSPPGPRLSWEELDGKWRRRDPELLAFYETLLRRLEGIDVFLNYNGINLHPRFVEQLSCVTVYSCADDPESSETLSKPVAASYDLCLVGNAAAVDLYRSWGVKNVSFWPLGFRNEDYNPGLDIESILHSHRQHPLTLLCERTSPWRKERLDKFSAAFPQGIYLGPGWPAGFLPEAERVPLLQNSRIGINFHNSTGPINFRTYYLPANGVMQICDNRSFLAQIFELGREVVGFDNVQEAIDACQYYLNHDDERRIIAAAGWKRATQDYSEIAVFNRLISAVQNFNNPCDYRPTPITICSTDKPCINVHTDLLYQPDQWCHRFEYLLKDVHRLPYRDINLLAPDVLARLAEIGTSDAIIGRFGHLPEDLSIIRPMYSQLVQLVKGRIFPCPASYNLYDDKRKQAELFLQRGYNTPITAWVENVEDLICFLKGTCLYFPLVVKSSAGAGSSGVYLAHSMSDVKYPCLIQEFCRRNEQDWRINVIGDRVMGFCRKNRENDFRASGSGNIVYIEELPTDLVEFAYRISTENQFDSMAYDFIRHEDRWVLIELSYAYTDSAVRDCRYYYDMISGKKLEKDDVYPQDFILEDFLNLHYKYELGNR